ncbi:MAG: hypothetical protein MJ162_04815 [Treponema sp.]|nr:hypothetical protein [Treponema sp.]
MIQNSNSYRKDEDKYADIINETWPKAENLLHPRMKLEDRAKIFLPFAALKGFEEEIAKRQQKIESEKE